MTEELILKWGSLKGWRNLSEKTFAILEEYYSHGVSMSAAMQKNNEAQKELLCKMIDSVEGEIYSDWTGELMTKEEAKEYILTYGKKNG